MKGSIRTRTLKTGARVYDAMFRSQDGAQRARTFSRRRDAERYLSENVVSVNNKTYRDLRPLTFRAFAIDWLDGLSNLKPSTRRVYHDIITGHLVAHFRDRLLHEISVADVNTYLATREAAGRKPKTLRNELALINKILGDARESHHLAVHPLTGSKALRRPRALRAEDIEEVEVFPPHELNALLDVIEAHYRHYYPYVLTSICTGMRPGEVAGLYWGDIDFVNKRIAVKRTFWRDADFATKTKGSRRAVDVGDQLLGTLRHLARERFGTEPVPSDEPIFLMAGGGRMLVTNFLTRVWRPALAKAGLRYRRPYCLRHGYATALLAQGQSIRYVSAQLGHSSPMMTLNIYGHALPTERQQAPARFEATLQAAREDGAPGRDGVTEIRRPGDSLHAR